MSDGERSSISRREALLRLSSTAIAASALGAGAWFFHDRRTTRGEEATLPDWRIPGVAPALASARGADAADNTRRAIAAVGGMKRFVARGDTVLIKPNIGWDRLPEQAADTNPTVVAELVGLCRTAGAGKVIVTDISCNDPRRCFARSGIKAAAEAAGALVLEPQQMRMVSAALLGYSTGLQVIEPLLRATKVINVPIVKHHSLSRVTLGMKNWFGVIGTGRNRLHQDIVRAVVELGAMFRPTLTVVDATRVLMANGPQGGSLGDVRAVNAVAAGTDVVMCDAWGAQQMGHNPRNLDFIAEAERHGLGRSDLSALVEA